MPDEQWKSIEGFPRYEVSNQGRVRSWAVKGRGKTDKLADKPKILTQSLLDSHYPRVNICNENGMTTALVQVLVLEAFSTKRPEGMVARHLNGDPLDNRLENLVWGTPKENTADRYLHGTANFLGQKIAPVLTDDEVIDVYIRAQQGEQGSSIAASYPNVSRETIRLICVGQSRKKVIRTYLESLNYESLIDDEALV